jgi:hypothetical protein
MALDPRKRQKKLERRAADRKAKRQQLEGAKQVGLAERLQSEAGHPILHCWVSMDLWTGGLGWVCLSRVLPDGSVAFAVFLVDRYCLGVKNALADITGRFTYESRIVREMRSAFTTNPMSPAAARKLVEGAVDYARSLGFPPHPDYQKARHIFGEIDAGECTETFEFGKDNKPFFVSGPHDGPERCRRIVETLERTCGPGGYHYLVGIVGDDVPDDPDEQDWPDAIGPAGSGSPA